MSIESELRGELLTAVEANILMHPRSQQSMVGPSEIGGCLRKLAYRLADWPKRADRASWRPTVGTAVHSWLEECMSTVVLDNGQRRYLTEERLEIGMVGDRMMYGNADLYDTVRGVVVDWKVMGPTSLRNLKANGPSESYDVQRHMYGYGFAQTGRPVHHVAIVGLPAAGELHEAVVDVAEYSEQRALEALNKARAVALALAEHGPEYVITRLPGKEDYCRTCPWLKLGSTNLMTGCPGVDMPTVAEQLAKANQTNPFAGTPKRLERHRHSESKPELSSSSPSPTRGATP